MSALIPATPWGTETYEKWKELTKVKLRDNMTALAFPWDLLAVTVGVKLSQSIGNFFKNKKFARIF